ncbi:MAG: hypothetical protein ABIJ92_05320 [Candidatus Aenigmatarchaeota archaeon]
MKISEIVCIGFDWDGTLADSMIGKAKYFADSIIQIYSEIEDKKRLNYLFIRTEGS